MDTEQEEIDLFAREKKSFSTLCYFEYSFVTQCWFWQQTFLFDESHRVRGRAQFVKYKQNSR